MRLGGLDVIAGPYIPHEVLVIGGIVIALVLVVLAIIGIIKLTNRRNKK